MVQVVNRSQQVVTAGLKPASAYSRIVVARCDAAGGGGWGFGYSSSFGQNAQLLNISANVQLVAGGVLEVTSFRLFRVSTIPQTRQDVEAGDELIDFGSFVLERGMYVRGHDRQFSWDMLKRFVGEVNRFGVVLHNIGTNNADIQVFFQISEG